MGTPRAGPDSCHSGSQCAGTVLDGDYGTEADSRFISPSVVLPAVRGEQEIHLRFWQWFSYTYQDAGYVQISIYDETASEWSDWTTTGGSVSEASTTWTLMDVDLTPYATKKIKIAFFYHTAEDVFVSTG